MSTTESKLEITDADIMSLAYDCNAMPEQMTDAGLIRFARALLAAERSIQPAASVTPVAGAVGYAWFLGEVGSERLVGLSTINSIGRQSAASAEPVAWQLARYAFTDADYVCTNAEGLMVAIDAHAIAHDDENPLDDSAQEEAEESVSEWRSGLRNAIYEYRKRVARYRAAPESGG